MAPEIFISLKYLPCYSFSFAKVVWSKEFLPRSGRWQNRNAKGRSDDLVPPPPHQNIAQHTRPIPLHLHGAPISRLSNCLTGMHPAVLQPWVHDVVTSTSNPSSLTHASPPMKPPKRAPTTEAAAAPNPNRPRGVPPHYRTSIVISSTCPSPPATAPPTSKHPHHANHHRRRPFSSFCSSVLFFTCT